MSYIFKKNYARVENYGSARVVSNIKYIVIHYTGNDGDSDESNAKYFHNNIVKASAHYFVDDNSVTQSVPDNYVAYSVGGSKYANCATTGGGKLYRKCTNANSISIELCDSVKNGTVYPTNATIENAIALTKVLMAKYKIPQKNVIRHFDVNGKSCPAYWCGTAQKDALWKTEFWNKLCGFVYNGIDYSLVFNPVYYCTKYADLKKAFGTDANKLFTHFCNYGMKEGRQAIGTFNVNTYKSRYIDLQKAFGNDLPSYYKHYIQYGSKEGRSAI